MDKGARRGSQGLSLLKADSEMRGWEISEQAEWEACMRAAEREAALHQRAAKRMREQEAAKERHTFLRRRAARVEPERVTEIAAEAAAACMGGDPFGRNAGGRLLCKRAPPDRWRFPICRADVIR